MRQSDLDRRKIVTGAAALRAGAILTLFSSMVMSSPSLAAPMKDSTDQGSEASLGFPPAPLKRSAGRSDINSRGKGNEIVLVTGLEHRPVDRATVEMIDGFIATFLGHGDDLQVITSKDIRTLLNLEAARQATDCDSVSCLTEIADALGARYVVSGRVGKMGSTIVLQIQLFDTRLLRPLSRVQVNAASTDELIALLPVVVADLAKPLVGDVEPQTQEVGFRPFFYSGVGLALGGATAAVGGAAGAYYFNRRLGLAEIGQKEKRDALIVGRIAAGVGAIGALSMIGGGTLAGVAQMKE